MAIKASLSQCMAIMASLAHGHQGLSLAVHGHQGLSRAWPSRPLSRSAGPLYLMAIKASITVHGHQGLSSAWPSRPVSQCMAIKASFAVPTNSCFTGDCDLNSSHALPFCTQVKLLELSNPLNFYPVLPHLSLLISGRPSSLLQPTL